MCLPLLCCAGAAACCAGRACCSCLCMPCARMGISAKNFAKLGYVFFQLFWIIIGIMIFFLARHLVNILPDFLQCPSQSGDGTACLGPSAIIRMSFILACFHLVVFIVTLTRGTFASVFHDGCWMLKFIAVFVAFAAALYIPNSFFQGYMEFSRYVSVIFLFAQALLMLIVAYKINEGLVGNYEKENPANGVGCSGIIIIAFTLLSTAGNITWTVYQYIWYKGCPYNVAMITVTLVVSVAFYVIVLFRTREDASLLTSSIVVSYILYLQWSALASNPDEECNPFAESDVNTTLQIVIGLAFTLMSLGVISSST